MRLEFLRSISGSALVVLWLTGCGPLFTPMTARLTPEDQRRIDVTWDNMLTPVGRPDRQTLLDTLIVFWLYQVGVDHFHLISEKYLTHGKVVMEVNCDRASPELDEFVVAVLDDRQSY